MAASVELTGFTQRSNGKYSSAPQWPLRTGYYTPARMPLNVVYPRPDGETNTYARHRWAHSGMEYQIPIGVQGGAWPFKYEIISAPAWLSIGQYYGDSNYGVLHGTPNTTGTHAITVRVTGADNVNYVDVQFTVQSDIGNAATVDAQFVFVQDGYVGTKVGTISQPLEDIADWYLNSDTNATYLNKIIVFRGGVYLATGNAAANPQSMTLNPLYKTSSIIGFPGEVVEWDCTNAKILTSEGASMSDLFVGDIVFKNARNDVPNAHFFYIVGNPNRITFFRNTFKDMLHGTVNDDNSNPIFSNDNHPAADKNYFFASYNTFDNVNTAGGAGNGGYIDIYKTSNVVIELNTVKNSNSYGGFWMKGTVSNVSVRGNTAIDNVAGGLFVLGYGGEAHSIPHDHELCWNNFKTSGVCLTFANSDTYEGQSYNTFIYRNSLQGSGGICRYPGAENFVVEANMLNFGTYGANWNESIQDQGIGNIKSATAIDSNGELTGALGFATHGWRPY